LPRVIAAAERRRAPASGLAQTIPAVEADVVVSVEPPCAIARDDDRLGADLEGEPVSRLRDVALPAGEQPDTGPHALPLEAGELRRRVPLLRDQAMSEVGLDGLLDRGGRARACGRFRRHGRLYHDRPSLDHVLAQAGAGRIGGRSETEYRIAFPRRGDH